MGIFHSFFFLFSAAAKPISQMRWHNKRFLQASHQTTPNAEGSSGAVLGGEEHRRRVEQRGEPKKEAEPITMTEETQYTPKTVKDVDAHEFVRQYAKHLKGKVSDRTIHDEGSGTGRGCTERARAVLPLAVAGALIGAFRSPCALALAPSPLASARPCRDRRPRERKERLSDKKINSFLSLSLSLCSLLHARTLTSSRPGATRS